MQKYEAFEADFFSWSLGETFNHKAGLSLAHHISPFTPVCSFWLSLLFMFFTPLQVTTLEKKDCCLDAACLFITECPLILPPCPPPRLWLTALGMRAGPSFRWHQRAGNSSSIKASSHESLLQGLQLRAATSSWGRVWVRGTEGQMGFGKKTKQQVTEAIMKWQQQQVKGGHWRDNL